jgi:hypothetical protein
VRLTIGRKSILAYASSSNRTTFSTIHPFRSTWAPTRPAAMSAYPRPCPRALARLLISGQDSTPSHHSLPVRSSRYPSSRPTSALRRRSRRRIALPLGLSAPTTTPTSAACTWISGARRRSTRTTAAPRMVRRVLYLTPTLSSSPTTRRSHRWRRCAHIRRS